MSCNFPGGTRENDVKSDSNWALSENMSRNFHQSHPGRLCCFRFVAYLMTLSVSGVDAVATVRTCALSGELWTRFHSYCAQSGMALRVLEALGVSCSLHDSCRPERNSSGSGMCYVITPRMRSSALTAGPDDPNTKHQWSQKHVHMQ